jgi:hypothetical protein
MTPQPNRSADARDFEPVHPNSPVAKADFFAVSLAYARALLAGTISYADPDAAPESEPADVEQLWWQANAP